MNRYLSSLLVLTLLSIPLTSHAANIVADYRDDFSGTAFPTGWQYLWNAPSGWDGSFTPAGNGNTGGIFSLGDYEPLASTGARWTVDGDTNSANGSPGRFLTLTSTGGHPGRGSNQNESGVNNTIDRYAIAAFTMPTSGNVMMFDSFYQNNNFGGSNGAEVIVHVDGVQTKQVIAPNNTAISLDHLIGQVNAGQTVFVALGPNNTDGSDGFATDFSLAIVPEFSVTEGHFRGDFQTGGAPDGWQYLWNAPEGWDGSSTPAGNGNTGAIGDPTNYEALNAVGTTYRVDNDTDPNNGSPGRFLNLGANGGHPGRGSGQTEGAVANSLDRYTIAAFEVFEAGDYAITDSFVDPVNAAGNGGDVIIHINDGPIVLQRFFDNAGTSFSTFLGQLNAGDIIYVGIGPNVADGNDSFLFDFKVTRFFDIPEPATATLALLGTAGLLRRRRSVA